MRQIESAFDGCVTHFLLFPVPVTILKKILTIIRARCLSHILNRRIDLCLWVDTCLCAYTTHGHCAVLNDTGIDHPTTLDELANSALAFAEAGADGISPSDMMDGRVGRIRAQLDENGFDLVPVMSYSTKFASNFYGPFRAAADSAPQFGDRKGYQLDVRNRTDALASSRRCAQKRRPSMVKPG